MSSATVMSGAYIVLSLALICESFQPRTINSLSKVLNYFLGTVYASFMARGWILLYPIYHWTSS